MKKLIEIQEAIMKIEHLSLKTKQRAQFDYKDDKHLHITFYCWQQAKAFKILLKSIPGILIYIEKDSELFIFEY